MSKIFDDFRGAISENLAINEFFKKRLRSSQKRKTTWMC